MKSGKKIINSPNKIYSRALPDLPGGRQHVELTFGHTSLKGNSAVGQNHSIAKIVILRTITCNSKRYFYLAITITISNKYDLCF